MKKVWLLGWIVVGAAFFLSLPAWGQGPGFNELDSNRDRKLSREELEKGFEAIFRRHDYNGDGYLTREEFKDIKGAPSRFEDLDENGDGRLDREELKKAGERRFRACDQNGDGLLDTGELHSCTEHPPKRGKALLFPERTTSDRRDRVGHMDEDLPSSPRFRSDVSPVFSVYF